MKEPQRVSDVPLGDAITLLIYGDQGSGKTWFLGTAGDRSLFLNLGAGEVTLQSPAFKSKVGANPLYVDLSIAAVSSKGNISDTFDRLCDTIDLYIEKYSHLFDTICIDDLTSLAYHAQMKGMSISSRSNTLATAKAKKTIPLAEVGDMGTEQNLLRWFFDTYTKVAKENKKHLVVAAHRQSVFTSPKKDGKTIMGEPVLRFVMPAVVGKSSFAPNVLPTYFDEVWYLERNAAGIDNKRQYKTTARTEPTTIITAKSRHGGIFATELVNPTFLNCIIAIKESKPYSGDGL